MAVISGFYPEYQKYLKAFYAESTIHLRLHHLGTFETWYEQNVPGEVGAISIKTCLRYVDYLLTDGYTKASAQGMVCTVRSLWQWLYLQELVPANPWREVPSLKLSNKSKTKPLTRDQLLAFFAAEDDKMFRAMWETFSTNGARLSEVRSLKVKDLDLADGWMSCIVKGGEARILPLGDRAIAALKDHLGERTSKPEDWVFPAEDPTKCKGPIGKSTIYNRLKVIAARVGMDPKLMHSHVFRHTYATLMHKAGANLQDIQEALGHKWVTTTQRYTHVDKHDVKKASLKAQQFHSLDRWTG